MKFLMFLITFFMLTLLPTGSLHAHPYDEMKCEQLHSSYAEVREKEVLLRLVERCPDLTRALNDLAYIYENEKSYTEALRYYQLSAKFAGPLFPVPYAGIGDVHLALYRQSAQPESEAALTHLSDAANAYNQWLNAIFIRKVMAPSVQQKQRVIYFKRLLETVDIDITLFDNHAHQESASAQDSLKRAARALCPIAMLNDVPPDVKEQRSQLMKRLFRIKKYKRGLLPQGCDPKADYETELSSRAATAVELYFLFDTNESLLPSEYQSELDKLAETLKSTPSEHYFITGHTDGRGSSQDNLSLSVRRARSLIKELSQRGVKHLQACGFGEKYPVASEVSEWGQSQNRRVLLYRGSKSSCKEVEAKEKQRSQSAMTR